MKARKIDNYIGKYSLSKTLRFELRPEGKTSENFKAKMLLEEDHKRSDDYAKVKKLIDDYHKNYINQSLSKISELDISEYANIYYKSNKDENDKKQLKTIESTLRKSINQALISSDIYTKLFKKELFTEILSEFYKDEEEKLRLILGFQNWVTYFQGFFENRKNLYTSEEKSTAIPYRCINDNLPRFLDNCRAYEKIKEGLPQDELANLNEEYYSLFGFYLDDYFNIDYFVYALPQNGITTAAQKTGIDIYNQVIGGYTNNDQTKEKVKGLNEVINLHNQNTDKSYRLPKLKMLYKQILSDTETISFIPENFKDDNEVLSSVNEGYIALVKYFPALQVIFDKLSDYDSMGIYIRQDCVSFLSQKITGDWSVISGQWNNEYDENNEKKTRNEKYYDERNKTYKNASFTINELQRLIDKYSASNEKEDGCISVIDYYSTTVGSMIKDIISYYKNAESLLTSKYTYDKKLAKNDAAIEQIKMLLDSIKELEWIIKQFMDTDLESNKDEVFYGEIQPIYDALREFDRLYDKVRNYITKKPYSKDKIKLNFQNTQFLNGWDKNKERDYRSVLLRKGEQYYLAIMEKNSNRIFEKYPTENNNGWNKIDYKLLPGPNKMLPKVFFAKKNIDYYAPSEEILRIREKETFKKGNNFIKKDCEKLIDFFKDSIAKHEEWSQYGFEFKDSKDYNDIGEFYNDVRKQGYKISYNNISEQYIMDLVDKGKIFLFRIYNKDFSNHSKGTPNMHTLYFKMLFDDRNLKNIVYQLNGGAEMFYRFPSLKLEETTIHHKGDPMTFKNPNNKHRDNQEKYKHDIIKDKRFTEPQFSLHIPITLNFKSQGIDKINMDVRRSLKECDDNYVIGIDRGERNLLYVTVINSKGKIVEQYSLNEIVNEYNGMKYKTDYHSLLDKKEKERDEARKNWKTIEGIKELKEGYISQAVHKICQLVVKYDAVIAMEDLNTGFKRSRTKVEKQVYQKFEKMLIDKLNYLVIDKNMDPEENGGLLRAYQLTNKFTSFRDMGKQNGFIFYVPAYLTSKIDPVTGFVDLLKPKYESKEKTQAMISNFDFVRYNVQTDMFEFGIDYSKVDRGSTSFITKWTVCTNGERIRTFRNKVKNNEWDDEKIVLTNDFKGLFESYDISYSDNNDIRDQLLEVDNTYFYKEFNELLRLTLQMRNSITGSDVDYMISPVRDKNGKYYDSNYFSDMENAPLPQNADANGAYNIARKALWCIEQIKAAEDDKIEKVNLAISNKEWLEYAQKK